LYTNNVPRTQVDGSNASSVFEIKKDGTIFTPTVTYEAGTSPDYKNKFTIASSLDAGDYQISIADNAIKNYVGIGIAATSYTFKVLNLSLDGINDPLEFDAKGEGYAPVPPQTVTIKNTGSATATDLSVVLTGDPDSCFVISKSTIASLAGNATTTFTVAPKTGLPGDTAQAGKLYTARVELRYQSTVLSGFDVRFTVKKLPPPVVEIDFENETLIYGEEGLYSINQGSPVLAEDKIVPIAETWMNDQQAVNVQIDPSTGAPSLPQPIVIPPRPEAPATVAKEDVSETGRNDGTIRGVNDSMQYKRDNTTVAPVTTSSSIALRAADNLDEWQDIPPGTKALENLSPGTYLLRYKAVPKMAFASKITVIVITERSIPLIERKILMPPVAEGVTASHMPGEHIIHSGDNFVFTLTFQGQPLTVKTSRVLEGVREELIGVPDSTGGYTYTIRQVRENVTIQIGDGANSNQTVTAASVWASDGHIYIRTPQQETVDVYTITGWLYRRIESASGAETSIPAASGVYMIRPENGPVHKVIVQ
jgi:hypothetical protein